MKTNNTAAGVDSLLHFQWNFPKMENVQQQGMF